MSAERYNHHLSGSFRNAAGGNPRGGTPDEWRDFRRKVLFGAKAPAVPPGFVLSRAAAREGLAAVAGDSITWLGHAAFLIRLGGVTILTDPYLSDFCSPFQALRLGPKRFTPAALRPRDLPAIDIVVVSHNHYDHLDAATIRALADKPRITAVVPLGLGEFFRKRGYTDVRELDWDQPTVRDGAVITALPAMHWSGRWLNDRNATLWCGFMLEAGGRRLYFAGDTGYGPVFAELGRRFGPFDLGMVPIGAYEPRPLMQAQHVNPEEAVQIGRDLGCRRLVGMHWGTVILTTEPPFEPPERFRAAGRDAGYGEDDIWVMRIGETRVLAAATVHQAPVAAD